MLQFSFDHPCAQDRQSVRVTNQFVHLVITLIFKNFSWNCTLFCRQLLLVDPTEKEEIVMNGRMTMAMNVHREICGAVMGGGVSLESDQVKVSSKSVSRNKQIHSNYHT